MRIAVHKALPVIVVASLVQVLSAEAFVPVGDVWVTAEDYASPPPETQCSRQGLPAAALVPTGDVWITPCPAPILSAEAPVPTETR